MLQRWAPLWVIPRQSELRVFGLIQVLSSLHPSLELMLKTQCPQGFQEMPVVLLQHGGLDNLTGKTGLAMLRHRKGPIVAVIDPVHAGQQLEQVA